MSLHVIIMAAGKGTRMRSALPKVLHPLAGKPLLAHVIETAQQLDPEQIHVIVGHEGARVRQNISTMHLNWISQTQQLGTGHAILQALPHIPPQAQVLILSGDVPCIRRETLMKLMQSTPETQEEALHLLVATLDQPQGLGRVIRNQAQHICAILEEKDATATERAIQEIYTGICYVNAKHLARWLPSLTNQNTQKEYYLTDIIALAAAEQRPILSTTVTETMEIQGINDRAQLQQVERFYQLEQAQQLLQAGVTLADATRFDLRGTLTCGQDVFIDINTIFQGDNVLGDECTIGANCLLTNVTLGKGCRILPHSVLENCIIGDHCQVGPFARLRTGTQLAADCKIGNFVETKKATFGEGTKASHLSYLGDVTIGTAVNIGAGTITCNYDGLHKHQTIIEDGAFIGSDTQLVAPVTVGKNATIGAGSTLRKDAPPEALTLTASSQKTIHGWHRHTLHAAVEENTSES